MTIAPEAIQKAAEALSQARDARMAIPRVSETFGISGLEAAYAVAEVNTRARLKAGLRAVGMKVGLTSRAVQQQLGVDQPDFGILFDDMEILSGDDVPMGRVIDQQVLFAMLRNRLYLGEMTHKGQSFTGQHEAIVTPQLWAVVHEYVENRKQGPRRHRGKTRALLAGLLYTPDGQRMLPTYTQKKNGKRYRYYVPYLEKRRSAGATYDPDRKSIGCLAAGEIEAAVLTQVHKALQEPEMIVGVWQAGMAWRCASGKKWMNRPWSWRCARWAPCGTTCFHKSSTGSWAC